MLIPPVLRRQVRRAAPDPVARQARLLAQGQSPPQRTLRNARAALVPAVAVPISIVGTFAAMYGFDYSLDNLSLMALTIATGFVVDDAIVVLENVSRHLEAGRSRVEAALIGAREVGFTVLSMSLSLIAVFRRSCSWAASSGACSRNSPWCCRWRS